MAKSNEAFWWSLFSGGGVMAALFVPGFILATGFVIPMSVGDDPQAAYERLSRTLALWPVRAVLFVVIFTQKNRHCHRCEIEPGDRMPHAADQDNGVQNHRQR